MINANGNTFLVQLNLAKITGNLNMHLILKNPAIMGALVKSSITNKPMASMVMNRSRDSST